MRLSILFMLIVSLCSAAANAEVKMNKDVLFIEGKLSGPDADTVVETINTHSVSTIVFRNSAGGEWRAGMRIGHFIAGKNITTVVEGICASACALGFLGGDKRQFSGIAPAPILFFHIPYSRGDQATIDNLKFAFFHWIEERTNRKLSQKFIDGISDVVSIRGGIFLFSPKDPIVKAGGGLTQICKGNETRIPLDCEKTEEISALNMGIINADDALPFSKD